MRSAFAILLSATLGAACAATGDQARRYAARGDQYVAAGRFDAAVIEYRNALKQQPRWADVHLKLADSYVALDKAEEAYREYASAIELLPGNTRSYLGMGRLLLDAGMYNEARLRAELILDHEPRNVDALLLYGRALNRQNRFTDAIGAFNTALALDTRPALYDGLGAAKAGLGDAKGAEAAYREGVDRNPRSVEARVSLAQFLLTAKRTREAEQDVLKAVELNPHDELANRAAASLYVTTGRRPQAEPYLKAAAAVPRQKLRSTLALADYYITERRYSEAKEVLQPATRDTSIETAARVRLAEIEYESSPQDAHATLDKLLKKSPTAEGWALKAKFLSRDGKSEEAYKAARAALDLDQRVALAHFIIGTVEFKRRNYDEAEHAFREVLQLNRMTSEATVELARTKLAEGHTDEAMALAESAGRTPEARLMLARVLTADGQTARARAELRQLQAGPTKSAEAALLLGTLDYDEGDLAAARAEAAQALQLAPTSVDALLLSARVALDADDEPAAEQYLRRLITRDPASFEGHTLLSQIYAARGDLEHARTTLESLAAHAPQSADARTAVGLTLQAAGRDGEARKWYEQALALRPDDAVAANKLARLYAADPATADSAVELARLAATRLPGEAEVHDTLGWAYYKAGKASMAAPELERAATLDPLDPQIKQHLNEVRRSLATEQTSQSVQSR